MFGNGISAFVLEDEPYLRKLGVAGIIGSTVVPERGLDD